MKSKPVIVIGAGLSGLCCARQLLRHNIDVLVLEAQDDIGGRVRTDRVDGFLLDRGFQVLQTAYPEASAQLDYRSLRLHRFDPGALIRTRGRMVEMSDPWRKPSRLFSTAFNGVGTFRDRLNLAKLRWHVTQTSVDDLWREPESTTRDYLSRTCGLSDDIIDRFFRPWFSGVFLEKDLSSSSGFFRFLFRIFATGDASLPEQGMGSIPRQLAAEFPPETLRLSTAVDSLVDRHHVRLRNGESVECRAVVLAVEGGEAAKLTSGMIQSPEFRATTCFYYAAPQAPFGEPLLVLNGDDDGPVNNLCVVSNVVKSYAPSGQALISCSVVGKDLMNSPDLNDAVLQQLRRWFGSQVDAWSLLRRYDIPIALPAQQCGFRDNLSGRSRLGDGIYSCGDYCETASIQGAMVSGRKAAENVIADLS
ncbi:MAG: NAD(P)/FAD-dependent oxidoreductase [Planctomycetota bacterium]